LMDGWWVFDRPLHRDLLFVVALFCGIAASIVAAAMPEGASAFVRLYSIVGGAFSGFYLFAILGGSVRNFVRGYREGRTS
jgi:hypothetical protein